MAARQALRLASTFLHRSRSAASSSSSSSPPFSCCCTASHQPSLAIAASNSASLSSSPRSFFIHTTARTFSSNAEDSSHTDDEYLAADDSTIPHNFFSQQAPDPSLSTAQASWPQPGRIFRDEDACHELPYESPNNNSALVRFSEPNDIYFPVKAFFISRRIDSKSLESEPFPGIISSRNSIIIKWKDRPPGSPPAPDKPGLPALATRSKSRFVVVFNYGSVVLFNFGDNEEEECLVTMRNHCKEQCEEAKKDDFDVLVRPGLEGWSLRGHDKVILKTINKDNVRIISSILGQSIALDHYGRKVDEMVNIFGELNQGMEKTGTFTMTRKELFKVVAAANSTLADVILRIGILERSEAAWKDANYAELWEILRDEFELDQRFTSFDFKLEIIQHNVRFFLEVLQNRKSAFLEWTIILLIAGEILVGLYQIFHDLGYW